MGLPFLAPPPSYHGREKWIAHVGCALHREKEAVMSQRVMSFKKLWIWSASILCATAMATMAAPGIQQAFGDTLTNNGTVDNVIVDNNGRVDVAEPNVVPDGKYEFSHNYDLPDHYKTWRYNEKSTPFTAYAYADFMPLDRVPDYLQCWRTDGKTGERTCIASSELDYRYKAEVNITDEKFAFGVNTKYEIVAVSDYRGLYSVLYTWNIKGPSYAPYSVKVTKISDNQAWVYIDPTEFSVGKSTIALYSGSKKIKTIKPTSTKLYKVVVKGKGAAKAKYKAVATLNGNSEAVPMTTKAGKAKPNVRNTGMKASLNDTYWGQAGGRTIKVYCSGGKLYADVWMYNSWNYTTKKNVKHTVNVTVDGKPYGKKTIKVSSMGPKSTKWFKKVYLGKKVCDLTGNAGTVSV